MPVLLEGLSVLNDLGRLVELVLITALLAGPTIVLAGIYVFFNA